MPEIFKGSNEAMTYADIVRDIMDVSAAGYEVETQQHVSSLCKVAQEMISEMTARTRGYMLLTFSLVSFAEMKKVLAEAKDKDKTLIEDVMKSIIGSFGRILN